MHCPDTTTQVIRVADVLLIGPLMMAGGAIARQQNTSLGNMLMLFGVTTTVYNARRYSKNVARCKALRATTHRG